MNIDRQQVKHSELFVFNSDIHYFVFKQSYN